MADVSHELGALRFVVDSPLSSKVAMFNNQVQQHKQSQLLNPFSAADGRCSPKPTFSKDEYGKPLAGSLTELRGQKANMHVLREMLELCQIISSEGYEVKDEPTMRVIPFGELFNIYNYISDKVVGILLRARKHKLVEFEGEMLFQRRDDDVPIFLLKPIKDIRQDLESKIEDIKRASSPAPQATSVLLDRSAHQLKLQEAGLSVPGSKRNSKSKSRSPSPTQQPLRSIASAPQFSLTPDTQDKNNVLFIGQEPIATSISNEIVLPNVETDKKIQDSDDIATKDKEVETSITAGDNKDLPTIVVEASTIYMREAPSNESIETDSKKDEDEQQQQKQQESGAVTFY